MINRGTIRTGGGWDLSASSYVSIDHFTNEGTIRIEGSQGRLELSNDWSNASGTIVVYGGTVVLNDDYTYSDIGQIQWMDPSYGTLQYRGTFDHEGHDLIFDDSMGTIEFGANLTGGRIVSEGSRPVVLYRGEHQGTVFSGEFMLYGSAVSGDIHLENGTVLRTPTPDGTYNGGGSLRTEGDATLRGTAEIIFDYGNGPSTVMQDPESLINAYGGTLTIGPDITIRTGQDGGKITGSQWINQGTILVETPGQQIKFDGSWRNEGTVRVSDGLLVLAGEWDRSAIYGIEQTGGRIMIGRDYDNTGASLILDQPTQAWGLKDRTLTGGRLEVSNGASFLVMNGDIDHATLAGDIIVQGGEFEGVMLDGANIYLEQQYPQRYPGDLRIIDDRLNGVGQFIFDDEDQEGMIWVYDGGPLVIDQGITIRTGRGNGIIYTDMINQGTIFADSPGTYLKLDGDWINEGELIVGDGLLLLGGSTVPDNIGQVARQGSGYVVLVGEMDLTSELLDLAQFDGDLALSVGARLHGGTITASSNERLVIPDVDTKTWRNNATGEIYLEDITLDTDLIVDVQKKVVLKGQITINDGHAIRLGSSTEDGGRAVLEFKSGSSLVGGGEMIFDATTNGTAHVIELAELGEETTIRSGTGDGKIYDTYVGLIRGTIRADQGGRSIEMIGPFHNYGSSVAADGGLLNIRSGGWINQPGSILQAQPGGVIEVRSDNVFNSDTINYGHIHADGGEIQFIYNALTNHPDATIRATAGGLISTSDDVLNEGLIVAEGGGSFSHNAGVFTNSSSGIVRAGSGGTIVLHALEANDGVLDIQGGVMRLAPRSWKMTEALLGNITNNGGSLYFDDWYDNSDGLLDMDGPWGQVVLDHESARITGGSITGSAGTALRVVRGGLNSVQVQSDIHVEGELYISGLSTLSQMVLLDRSDAQGPEPAVWIQGKVFFEGVNVEVPLWIESFGQLFVDPASTFKPYSTIHMTGNSNLTFEGHRLLSEMTIEMSNGTPGMLLLDNLEQLYRGESGRRGDKPDRQSPSTRGGAELSPSGRGRLGLPDCIAGLWAAALSRN